MRSLLIACAFSAGLAAQGYLLPTTSYPCGTTGVYSACGFVFGLGGAEFYTLGQQFNVWVDPVAQEKTYSSVVYPALAGPHGVCALQPQALLCLTVGPPQALTLPLHITNTAPLQTFAPQVVIWMQQPAQAAAWHAQFSIPYNLSGPTITAAGLFVWREGFTWRCISTDCHQVTL